MALLDDGFAALTDLRIAFGAGDRIGCHVFVFSPRTRARPQDWHRISMDGRVADQLADSARRSLATIEARAADENALAEFDFDAMADGSVGLLPTRDAPAIVDWLAQVPNDDWPLRFDGDEDVLKRARYYATRLNFADGRELLLFRGSRGLNISLRTNTAVAGLFSRDTHEMTPVEGAVISFDGNIDFFVWDGFVFIINLYTFESVTNIREITARKAGEAIDTISARFHVANVDALKDAIGKRARLAKKLAAAHQHGIVGDIQIGRLEDRIVGKNLNVRCTIEGANASFEIDPDDRSQVEDFVNLMSDFYLHSPVTDREWEALVKRVPRGRR